MAFEPTEEQAQIINARNTSLLVSAAAGSGKTAVLVERIVPLISTGSWSSPSPRQQLRR